MSAQAAAEGVSNMNKNHLAGYLNLALAASLLGSSFVFSKYLLAVFSPLLLITLQFFIGTIIFAVLILFKAGKFTKNHQNLTRKDCILLFAQGGFAAVANLFLIYGLELSTASMQGLLTSTSPAFTTFFAWLILKENITKFKIYTILMMMFGIAILNIQDLIQGTSGSHLTGNGLIMVYVLLSSMVSIFIKLLPNYVTAFLMALIGCLISFTVYLTSFLIFEKNTAIHFDKIHLSTIAILIISASINTVLYALLWNNGLVKVEANRAVLFSGLIPITAIILAAIFLGETITWSHVIGLIIILSALSLSMLKNK